MRNKRLTAAFCGLTLSLSLAVSVYCVNRNRNDSKINTNIEAIASVEWPWNKIHDCYNTITAVPAMQVYYCPECRYVNGVGELSSLSTCHK